MQWGVYGMSTMTLEQAKKNMRSFIALGMRYCDLSTLLDSLRVIDAHLTSREVKGENGVNTKPVPVSNVKPNTTPAPPRRSEAAQPAEKTSGEDAEGLYPAVSDVFDVPSGSTEKPEQAVGD